MISKEKTTQAFLLVILLSLFLTFLHQAIAPYNGVLKFFGQKDNAVLDWWSIQHLLTGVVIGSWLIYSNYVSENSWQKVTFMVFLMSFSWECFELFMELGSLTLFEARHWNYGYEHWVNRAISDQVVTVAGGVIGYKYKEAWKWTLFPVVAWMLISLFI